MTNDTICAISTPFGRGAIALIRVSGKNALSEVSKAFKGKNLLNAKTHTINHGFIIDNSKNIIDEVLISIMKGPKSFTGEDVVEISTHGGILVTQKVLERLLELKIRLANPGEFSMRAFLNGKIDLIQADGIIEMIDAKNENALKIAKASLTKKISNIINALRDELLDIIAAIEVNIDYPEYDDVQIIENEIVKPKVLNLIEKLEKLIEKQQEMQFIKDGVKVAIIGRPNVGKSSLLNLLLQEEKAIVTNIAGTTRDVIETSLNIKGITINLFDTAGIRKTDDKIEKIGVEKSKDILLKADLVLLVIDKSQRLQEEDLKLLKLTENKTRIIILNKTDLNLNNVKIDEGIDFSTKTDDFIESLRDKIVEVLSISKIDEKDFNYLSNIRHINKVKDATLALKNVLVGIEKNFPIDILTIDLKESWNLLGDIVGKRYDDELIDELFSKFCLGK